LVEPRRVVRTHARSLIRFSESGYRLQTATEEVTTVSLNDKAHNTAETARGKAKEAVGRATDDRGIELEGKVEQVIGHLKQAGEKVKDALRSGSNRQGS
jgi:uncharacterized protein YjbJ (UPF0337 family)